ncbi:MAG TPA: TatD family hydrolase [Candidatus Paceibacterota bacterium]|nr:TatD family hydrolase [Candidatus Paceibacterota bacterium]
MDSEFRYIDVHTHLNLDAFDADRTAVETRTLEDRVAHINVGTARETSEAAIRLAESFNAGVYATVGLHPVRASGASEHEGTEAFDHEAFQALGAHEKVVAIGECGLDYFRVEKDTKAKQEGAFSAQIALANELEKPLMLHIRDEKGKMDAYEDALAILKREAKVLGNVHFFAGTYDIAKRFWEMGYTTSFTGVVTFADEYDDIIKNAPLDMLHAETDAPYVAPVPFRGTRNEPAHVREVYARIAALRSEDPEVVRRALLENARRLFGVLI